MTKKITDIEDILFFGTFARQDPLFSEFEESKKVEFSRLASRCALLTELIRGKLTATLSDEKVCFCIEVNKIELSTEMLKSLDNILTVASVDISPSTLGTAISVSYSL